MLQQKEPESLKRSQEAREPQHPSRERSDPRELEPPGRSISEEQAELETR